MVLPIHSIALFITPSLYYRSYVFSTYVRWSTFSSAHFAPHRMAQQKCQSIAHSKLWIVLVVCSVNLSHSCNLTTLFFTDACQSLTLRLLTWQRSQMMISNLKFPSVHQSQQCWRSRSVGTNSKVTCNSMLRCTEEKYNFCLSKIGLCY